MGDVDYEHWGIGYAVRRRADPTIAHLIRRSLGDVRSVLNVGAGAGSYEPPDLRVVAVEPSPPMRAQRPPGAAPVVAARAESLPFGDEVFDAAMATVTVHQWEDPWGGLAELRRASRGPVAILTFDGSCLDRLWLAEYLPELVDVESRRYPAIGAICDALGGRCEVTPVPIPIDCPDGFTEAYYARPEAFLDESVRRSQSAWSFVSTEATERAVGRLGADLATGRWDQRWGHLRRQATFLGALRLITARGMAT